MRKTAIAAILSAASLVLVSTHAPAATRDRTPPSVSYTTPDDSVLVWSPVPATGFNAVTGRAADAGTGIARVTLTFCTGSKTNGGWVCNPSGLGQIVSGTVTLVCGTGRHTCTWSSSLPQTPGMYLALLRAWDRAGNARSPVDPIQVVVL